MTDPIRTIARLLCAAQGVDYHIDISVDGGPDTQLGLRIEEQVRHAMADAFTPDEVRMLARAATEMRAKDCRYAENVQAFAEKLERMTGHR